MAFHVGQKVVCVDVNNYFMSGEPHALVLNAVYEVCEDHGWAVNLIGFPSGYMTAFNNIRFRAAVERKTNISIFTEMLKPEPNAPVKKRERV